MGSDQALQNTRYAHARINKCECFLSHLVNATVLSSRYNQINPTENIKTVATVFHALLFHLQ